MTMRRRDALKSIGGLAGAAAMSRFLPGCGGNDAPTGITTYVYMMMENRSYDHYFGSRSMIEGLPGNGPMAGATNPDLQGAAVPLWLPNQQQMCDPDPPHGWDALHASWNMGACDGFVKEHQKDYPGAIDPMQYLTRDMLPVSYALADAYTSCDRWFCSVMGPTWPNRFYWHTGTSGGLMTNEIPTNGGISWPTIYHRLNDKKVEWTYYYGSIPVVGVVNGLVTDGPGGSRIKRFEQFMLDAAAGTLPPVVYIDPAFYENDDHPPIHPINGQELIATVYKALASSPQWNNIMFVLTYDENGGFYDHVSPPNGVPDDNAATGFDQLGFRVPALVMGPYAKQGQVVSTEYNHASALAHLQNVFELENLTMRTAAATDLTDCIDMERLMKNDPAPPIELPDVDVTAWPMPAACTYQGGGAVAPPGGGAPHLDPISEWANKYPERVAGMDLRGETATYRKHIRNYLRDGVLPNGKRQR